MCLYNKMGRNGKSKLVEILTYAFGGLIQTINRACLVTDKKTHGSADNAHAAHLFDTEHPHIGIVSESHEGRIWHPENARNLSGGDDIQARRPHKTNSELFRPRATMLLLCNDIPKEPNDAIIGRLLLWLLAQRYLEPSELSQPPRFNEHVRNEKLMDDLIPEMPAIVAFFRRGMELADQNGGIFIAPSMKRYKADYLASCNLTLLFIKDCCVKDHTQPVQKAVPVEFLYKIYRAWCESRSQKPENKTEFRANVLRATGANDTIKKKGVHDGEKHRYAGLLLALGGPGGKERDVTKDDWFQAFASKEFTELDEGGSTKLKDPIPQVITFAHQESNVPASSNS